MPKVQTYLCVFVVILHSVCASSESSIDYDALNSQIDAFTASLDAAYPTFNYNNIASEINSLASGLTKNDITITPLPNYSSYIQTAQPEETLVTPSVFVSDIIKSQSNYLATRSSQQTSSPSQAGLCPECSCLISMRSLHAFCSFNFFHSVHTFKFYHFSSNLLINNERKSHSGVPCVDKDRQWNTFRGIV